VCVHGSNPERHETWPPGFFYLKKKKKRKKNLTVQCLFGAPIALGFFVVVFAIRVVVWLNKKKETKK
jgi:hypothetical protein